MKNTTQHTGTLEIIERLPSSYFGNPRFLVKVAGVTARTQVDACLGYSIQNHEGKQVNAVIGTHYGYPTIDSLKPLEGK